MLHSTRSLIQSNLTFQAPDGESQPSTEVDLFISTEKIMVLNTDLKVSDDANLNCQFKVTVIAMAFDRFET